MLVALLALGFASFSRAELQPFPMPWDDATAGITSLQTWQPAAAGANGWVQVTPDGHYKVGGTRIRFLGVNVASASAMPTHAHAVAHAARLARFGFNTVRLHHLEAPWDKDNVLIDYASGSSRNLSADRLDRLHYFIAQLAAKGLYIDLNLLVSREFQATDGLGPEITQMGWKDQHVLGFFNDTALALHKEYATKLLTAPNPYRNNVPLGLDPAVAFVEIMNENGLLQKWHEGVLDSMPAIYRDQMQTRWNQWLAQRYADTAGLLAGWGAIDEPLGANMLANGDFAAGVSSWNAEQHDTAVATFTGTNDFNGSPALRIAVTTPGSANWHVQLNQAPLALLADGYYTISFWAKASGAVPLSSGLTRAYGDYGSIGIGVNTTLGTTWQHYVVALQNGAAELNARINFGGFGNSACTVWLADVRVQPGGRIGGLPDGVALESGNVPSLLRNGNGAAYTLDQRQDWTRCLLGLEAAYWNAMNQHLKATLHYPGIVWGTIIANSPPNEQADLDAIDSHAYWQHPTWPPGKDWDPVDWTIQNIAMTNDPTGGVIGGIARQRVKGKPHNVTEYEHPSPNSYTAEGPLLAAAYASLQDWDGIWMFAYETNEAEFVTSFFDHGTHPGRMANNLLAAALFRRGDVAAANSEITMAFPPDKEVEVATSLGGAWSVGDGSHLGVPAALSLVSRLNLSLGAGATDLASPPAAPIGGAIASDTGGLLWDNSHAGKGVVTVNTAKTKAVVGFTDGRSWTLGDVQIAPGATSLDWCTIGITLLEGTTFDATTHGRALIVATGETESTGQIWKDASHTSIGSNWGSAPMLIETVPATIVLPVASGRVTAWALDARGQRTSALSITNAGGKAQLTLGGNGTTLWYEVEIASAPPAITLQPQSYSIAANGNVTFSVTASGYPQPDFQWQVSTDSGSTWNDLADGGVYSGATTGALAVHNVTVAMNGFRFRSIATNSEGSTASSVARLDVATTAGPRLINVSCLAAAGTGENTLIMGFYISGTGSKTLLIRGVGPGMLPYYTASLVPDPMITLYKGNTPIASDDDWNPALESDFASIGAFPLTAGSTDAAIKETLAPGLYSVHLVNNAEVAEGLIEVYDLSRDLGTRLTNVSCRLNLGTNQLVILGTAIIGGSVPLLARNVGPELANYGLDPDSVLPNPHLLVYSGQTAIGVNEDWETDTGNYFGPVGAFPLTNGSADAAIRVVSPPGSLTIHATGNGGSGVTLIELYESP